MMQIQIHDAKLLDLHNVITSSLMITFLYYIKMDEDSSKIYLNNYIHVNKRYKAPQPSTELIRNQIEKIHLNNCLICNFYIYVCTQKCYLFGNDVI